ncbi:TPA: site-specific integrase [Pseudomonas aeruginosa]|nr:site-specific integrase [Pseudomonas aeruginosa]HBO4702837.1 site-specific integrase [Pseudomonas aeruginosa]
MDTEPSISKVVCSKFRLAVPTTRLPNIEPYNKTQLASGETLCWCPSPFSENHTSTRFPILLEEDGSPWIDGNLYLLYRLKTNPEIDPDTLKSIANDLIEFRTILKSESTCYTHDSYYKSKRPTYIVKRVLKSRVDSGKSVNSANRIISHITEFYRWLIHYERANFRHELFLEKSRLIPFEDEYGLQKFIKSRSTDLTLKQRTQNGVRENTIDDGGKLRPLPPTEISLILKALSEIGNPEMSLAFQIALTTGARIQTVFTLRLGLIKENNVDNNESIPVVVGGGTLTDTKRDKRYTLYIPGWLHNRIREYSQHSRAVDRRNIAKNHLGHTCNQYIFLTRSGSPYYIHRRDAQIQDYEHPPKGEAVRKFISRELLPLLRLNKSNFKFSFHDLRATFGMTLIRAGLTRIELGKESKDNLLNYVKERMGHSSIRTTLLYLNYDFRNAISEKAQEDWEIHIKELTESGLEFLCVLKNEEEKFD